MNDGIFIIVSANHSASIVSRNGKNVSCDYGASNDFKENRSLVKQY